MPTLSKDSSCYRVCLLTHGECTRGRIAYHDTGTERLDRSTQRLKASQALAHETEAIGASTLAQLQQQRETIDHTTRVLYESEGYVDRSLKSLKGIARRYEVFSFPPDGMAVLTRRSEGWLRIG
jgi:hypothetical protein